MNIRLRLAAGFIGAAVLIGVFAGTVRSTQSSPPPLPGTDLLTNAVDISTWDSRIPVVAPVTGELGGYVDVDAMFSSDVDPVPVYAEPTGTVIVGYFHRGDAEAGDPGGFSAL